MNDLLTVHHLGPARVLATEGSRVLVSLGEARAWATLAMPLAYAPEVGDTLLVVGKDEAFYAIGVIAGRGRTSLTAAGDLSLSAPHGRIDLHARDGVEVRSSVFRCVAEKWDAVLGTVRQRCSELWFQVRGVARWRAQRSETTVDDVARTRAGRIVQQARGAVQIDGEKVELG